jgi:hypothetical protein
MDARGATILVFIRILIHPHDNPSKDPNAPTLHMPVHPLLVLTNNAFISHQD